MALKIRFVTDYVCPYCIAAKMPLMKAIGDRDITVEWLPFELTPEPEPGIDTYHDTVRKEKWEKTLKPYTDALGLNMKLPPKVIPRPYTRMAFEGYHYAKEHGQGEAYNSRVYEAYFIDELDIGDIHVLCRLAKEVGLDENDFRKALENGTYTQLHKELDNYTKNELKVRSVPTIFIGDKRVEGGVYTVEGFEKLIEEALSKDDSLVNTGFGCNENGCGF